MARNHQVAEKNDGTNMNEYFDKCNDVLAPLGHASRHIHTTRRDFRKPELMSENLHLCSHSVPFTKWLFGDDVSKTAKDIEDCSKIGNKLRFGRARGGYRGGRSHRGGRGGYCGNRGARGRDLPPGYRIPKHTTTNFQRGGYSQAQQRDKN